MVYNDLEICSWIWSATEYKKGFWVWSGINIKLVVRFEYDFRFRTVWNWIWSGIDYGMKYWTRSRIEIENGLPRI